MRQLKLWVLFSAGVLSALLPNVMAQRKTTPTRLSAFRQNICVTCHSRLTEPLLVSAHFYEWFNSKHERSGIGCEKCHGGNPAATTYKAAHDGVLRATFPNSTLNAQNLPATCGKCHQELVSEFITSSHYQRLRASGTGPGCTTCHLHMATKVIYWPPETGQLCAQCHQRADGPAADKPSIPDQAVAVIAAFTRADEVIDWSYYLMREAQKKNQRFPAQTAELRQLAAILKEAKLSFHAFDLKSSRQKADEVFTRGNKVKDYIWPKVD